jgi:hypothetical protein
MMEIAATQTALRDRLSTLLASQVGANVKPTDGVARDVLVSHIEVTHHHGVGVLLQRALGAGEGFVSIRSHEQFGGEQSFGDWHVRLQHRTGPRPAIYEDVLRTVSGLRVNRIVVCPYYADDVRTAIALRDLHGAPMCTWIQDDQNVVERGIPDPLMRELLERSRLRLAISGEMREAYEEKYDLEFNVLPPTVLPHHVQCMPLDAPGTARSGAIVGNIWGQHWLGLLRNALRESTLSFDWYCNSGARWLSASEAELAADGIVVRGALPEEQLKREFATRPFAVVPSGTLDEWDDRRAIATLSLPSRVVFISAAANAPILVLGSKDTTAARFVEANGIGVTAAYEPAAISAAVTRLLDPAIQKKMRAAAAELAPSFSSGGMREWLWRSLELGEPADRRFEDLFPRQGRTTTMHGRVSEGRC